MTHLSCNKNINIVGLATFIAPAPVEEVTFPNFKLWIAVARHNFKWVKIHVVDPLKTFFGNQLFPIEYTAYHVK